MLHQCGFLLRIVKIAVFSSIFASNIIFERLWKMYILFNLTPLSLVLFRIDLADPPPPIDLYVLNGWSLRMIFVSISTFQPTTRWWRHLLLSLWWAQTFLAWRQTWATSNNSEFIRHKVVKSYELDMLKIWPNENAMLLCTRHFDTKNIATSHQNNICVFLS